MMRLLIVILSFLPVLAIAETAYITDNLRLGLHQAADTSDRAFRMLESGQELEVISRDRNYANVRLPDGSQGYVKAAYLVDEKPARLIVAETIAARDALSAELEETRRAFEAPAATIEALREEAAGLSSRLEIADKAILDLEQENAGIRGLKEQYKGSVPLTWVGAVMALCLVAGFVLGWWWIDRSSRKRHGGIRIY